MNLSIDERIQSELTLYEKDASIDEIVENIFIGNYAAALQKDLLVEKGVTHILVAGSNLEGIYQNDFVYKIIPLYDSEYTKISKYFKDSNNFIEEAVSKGKILVHCGHGISRSVSLVIAYIIKNFSMTYSDAIKLVKEKRSIAKPNPGFERDLRNFSYEIYKKF